jgi:hypothetical protein
MSKVPDETPSLKRILDEARDSIARGEGIPAEQVKAETRRLIEQCVEASRRKRRARL